MGIPPVVNGRQHLGAQVGGVTIRVVFVFGRDGMRTEEGGGNIERTFGIQEQQSLQHAQLSLGLQAITGLGFGGGGAVGEHLPQAWAGLHPAVFGGKPGG